MTNLIGKHVFFYGHEAIIKNINIKNQFKLEFINSEHLKTLHRKSRSIYIDKFYITPSYLVPDIIAGELIEKRLVSKMLLTPKQVYENIKLFTPNELIYIFRIYQELSEQEILNILIENNKIGYVLEYRQMSSEFWDIAIDLLSIYGKEKLGRYQKLDEKFIINNLEKLNSVAVLNIIKYQKYLSNDFKKQLSILFKLI